MRFSWQLENPVEESREEETEEDEAAELEIDRYKEERTCGNRGISVPHPARGIWDGNNFIGFPAQLRSGSDKDQQQ
jgi:hypothetical protein